MKEALAVIQATRPNLLIPNREDSHEDFLIDIDEDSACPFEEGEGQRGDDNEEDAERGVIASGRGGAGRP